MDISALVQSHGYWLLAIGCFLEGETILLLAGLAAHLGYLNVWAVLSIAIVSGFSGDQFFFWLGRQYGSRILAAKPAWALKAQRVHQLVERYDAPVVIGIRFAYGLRIAGPIIIGMSAITWQRLMVFNFIGAVVWAIAIIGLGWAFGHAAELFLDDIHQLQVWLLLAVVVLAAMVWWFQKRKRR